MTCSEWDCYTLSPPSQEYDMNTISKEVELPGAFVLGAAGAPSRVLGMNAEVTLFFTPITPQAPTSIPLFSAADAFLCLILSPDAIVKGLIACRIYTFLAVYVATELLD